jgi:hypothetical protein
LELRQLRRVQKAVELFKTLEDDLAAPFVSGENGTSEEVPTREALSRRSWRRPRRTCRYNVTRD